MLKTADQLGYIVLGQYLSEGTLKRKREKIRLKQGVKSIH